MFEKPLHPIVASMVANLNSDLREDFEERAAIMEFEAGLDRTLAEALALLCVLQNHPVCLRPLVALEVQLNGEHRHLITGSLGDTQLRIQTMGGSIVHVLDPIELLRAEFHDTAWLAVF